MENFIFVTSAAIFLATCVLSGLSALFFTILIANSIQRKLPAEKFLYAGLYALLWAICFSILQFCVLYITG